MIMVRFIFEMSEWFSGYFWISIIILDFFMICGLGEEQQKILTGWIHGHSACCCALN